MATRRARDDTSEEVSTSRPTSEQRRWLLIAVVVGLVLYPALIVTLSLLGSRFGLDLPGPPDFAGGILNYSNLLGLAVFAAVWWCLLRGGSSLSGIGFPTRWRWWQLCLICSVVVLVVISTVSVTLSDAVPSPSATSTGISLLTFTDRFGYIFGGAVRAGVVEETLFRGIALTHLPGILFGGRVWPAVFIPSIIFVLAHGESSVSVMLVRAGFALIYCTLFLWRRSLRLPIILHWLVNAIPYATIP